MENRYLTYDLDKLFITINFYELVNNISINKTKRYLIKDYDTKEKILGDLFNNIITDFDLDNKYNDEFYDMLDLMLDNLCKELNKKEDK